MTAKTLKQVVKGAIETLHYYETVDFCAQRVVSDIQEQFRVEPKGTEINPESVQKGDQIRVEWNDEVTERLVATGPMTDLFDRSIYLLHRPDPDDAFVFPAGDGAVVRMTSKATGKVGSAVNRGIGWAATGWGVNLSEDELRDFYCNFKVLDGGAAGE